MIRISRLILIMTLVSTQCLRAMDLEKVDKDLNTPSVTNGVPAPGKRVKLFLPKYDGTDVYHSLYLPINWKKEEKYPVFVEYSGNKWQNSQGTVDECDLGYGITEGKGVIWICLPFVDKENGKNAATWWGDVDATVDYCKQAVSNVCAEYGGDSSKVFIAGFSRGAIACNYIGLHDNEIASLWRGFICHSHYDGVKQWEYTGSDRSSAATRLKRLGNRPQFISQEKSVDPTKTYLKKAFPSGNFTFLALPFADHTDQWVLRDIPERKILREWFENALKEKGQQAPAGDDLKAAPEAGRCDCRKSVVTLRMWSSLNGPCDKVCLNKLRGTNPWLATSLTTIIS